ncbi:MAG: MFS transporter [Acidimicrobiales bacterium]
MTPARQNPSDLMPGPGGNGSPRPATEPPVSTVGVDGVDGDPPGPPSTHRAGFWGWRVALAGAGTQMLVAGLVQHAYTNYSVLLREEFGWSATLVAFGFAMNRLESGLLGPVQGWMIDRFGPRTVMRIGAVILAIGLMGFSTLQNAVQFFLFYFVVAVGASLAGFITVVTVVVNWFERRRSTALAVAQAGFPIGGVLTPAVVFCLTEFGWRRTAFGSAWVVLVAVLALSQVMHTRPSDLGQEVDGGRPETGDGGTLGAGGHAGAVAERQRDFTVGEAVRTRAFWMLNLGHATALLVVGSTMAHLAIYLTEDQGFSLTGAGLLGTSLMLTQLVGQVAGGYFGDRMSKQRLVVGAMGGHVIGMVLFTFAVAPWMVWAFVPFHGLAWGVRGPLLQAIRADYFGASSFGRIMGWSSLIMMLGTMSGPIIVGMVRDATGSYTIGFTIITVGASLATVFFLLAGRPSLPAADGAMAAGDGDGVSR